MLYNVEVLKELAIGVGLSFGLGGHDRRDDRLLNYGPRVLPCYTCLREDH